MLSSMGPSKVSISQKNGSLFIYLKARSLKSVLVPPVQILGPFGPPKNRVNFDMFK